MAKELTVKQRKLVQGIAAGKTKKQAAIDAGYSPRSAPQNADEALKNPNVRDAFLAAMEKAGINDETLSKVMKEGLAAKRTISAVVINQTNDVGEEREADGDTKDFVEVPDHRTRHKFLETAMDVKGTKAPRETKVQVAGMEELLNTLDDDDEGEA